MRVGGLLSPVRQFCVPPASISQPLCLCHNFVGTTVPNFLLSRQRLGLAEPGLLRGLPNPQSSRSQTVTYKGAAILPTLRSDS